MSIRPVICKLDVRDDLPHPFLFVIHPFDVPQFTDKGSFFKTCEDGFHDASMPGSLLIVYHTGRQDGVFVLHKED